MVICCKGNKLFDKEGVFLFILWIINSLEIYNDFPIYLSAC